MSCEAGAGLSVYIIHAWMRVWLYFFPVLSFTISNNKVVPAPPYRHFWTVGVLADDEKRSDLPCDR